MKKLYIVLITIMCVAVGIHIYLVNTYDEASRRLSIAPNFTLTDMYGNTVTLNDYKGKRVFVSFGYTNCVDVCPVTLATMTNLLYDIEETYPDAKHKYQGLFITVDPERDSSAVLKDYIVDVFHDNVVGLTGTPEQIRAVADSFNIDYEKYGETKDGYYSMIHSVYIFAIDENGEYQTYFAHTSPPKAILQILHRYYDDF